MTGRLAREYRMSKEPIRIQLSRRHGWQMPPKTMSVARPTRWGNPFDVREYGLELALRLFEDTARGTWSPASVAHVDEPTYEMLYAAHCAWLRRLGRHPIEAARAELRGRHLACWCGRPGAGEPDHCHAAILLRIANE
jgi:hypothetical protein